MAFSSLTPSTQLTRTILHHFSNAQLVASAYRSLASLVRFLPHNCVHSDTIFRLIYMKLEESNSSIIWQAHVHGGIGGTLGEAFKLPSFRPARSWLAAMNQEFQGFSTSSAHLFCWPQVINNPIGAILLWQQDGSYKNTNETKVLVNLLLSYDCHLSSWTSTIVVWIPYLFTFW